VPSLDRHDDVFLLDLGDSENRFHPEWLAEVEGYLAHVEAADGARALVTTGTGKFYSNGLDLDWVNGHPDQFTRYVTDVQALLARLLAAPLPTVAAIQGHAFAAGAMFALAHDFRIMRADRGFFCLPEVDIGIPFTRGMSGLIQSRLTKKTAHEAMTTGRRYGGDEALQAGLVDAVAAADEVVGQATERAQSLAAKAGATLGTIKARLYPDVLAALRDLETPLD
jgi:enoyl-CoA hydratase/carnithine racemase